MPPPYPPLRRRASHAISPGMTHSTGPAQAKRATQRPGRFDKPAYWSDTPPPVPAAPSGSEEDLSPTRYGDWVKDGIAIDF